jgi:hypothetical protein
MGRSLVCVPTENVAIAGPGSKVKAYGVAETGFPLKVKDFSVC